MAKGDVVGVATYLDGSGGAATHLQLADGKGGEEQGPQIVWCADRNAWAQIKPADSVSDAERRTFRNRPVPGDLLEPQPPQEKAELTPEIIERGVTAKALAILNHPEGGKPMVREYLQSRLDVGLLSVDLAASIAERVGVAPPKEV